MTDLSQHTSYTAAYSGLLNNFWLTLAIAGACLLGHEIGIRIPRRRGRDGRFRRVGARIALSVRRVWRRRRRRKKAGGDELSKRTEDKQLSKEERKRREATKAREELGDRESWEFGQSVLRVCKKSAHNAVSTNPKYGHCTSRSIPFPLID
jgi:hypothetical protein